ncbi:ketoacyl-ACP synthase III [Wenzhouxiangella sp. XN79A]|uniref:beta-ketoacyl-ACP synthase III n=1 Tax=Wenzhouxiangella sp. XN79A TaxID=2724193 RepID=UPI00144A6A67|nr:beta-ketoacyl-ACP synthase III [Wenzhouxiangella sp. XN79A]NKI34477.1 ketoacyl-ACP synthase III [Wenzhouxiangella sp. XN79A]
MHARIIGTGHYLPDRVLTNTDLEEFVDTTDSWIQERTGIRERRIAADGQTTGDLAEQAARRALEAAEIDPATIDLLIVGTTTPDVVFPSTACLIQQRLGLGECGAFDVNAACSGFIYALSIATQYIEAGTVKRALVIGAETLSRLLDWDDRATCVLFGDGAGAAVLEASEEAGVMSTHIHANGNYGDLLKVDVGVSRGFTEGPRGGLKILMKGNEVFKVAVNTLGRIVDETLAYNQLDKHDLDWLIPHQANLRIIKATAKKLDMPMDRVIVTVDRHGNTSAASVPMALDEAIRSGRVKRGDLMLLEAFGGGFTWGASLIRY